jgi:putative ABC transport system permease protein
LFVPGVEPSGLGHTEFHNPDKGVLPGTLFFENNADDGFLNTYKLNLLAGRNFYPDPRQNYRNIIINETARTQLGFDNPEEAIGRWIFRRGNDTTRYTIVGVVADFHNEGLQKPIYPIVWNNNYPREFGYYAIRVNTQNVQQTINQLQAVWDRHFTKDKFDYVFADEQFNKQYTSESRYSNFYVWLTILSIAISTIGLYGLILFYLGKRNKEIGLRKVNGATVFQVVFLLNKNFLAWVGIAFLIACPVAWYAMSNWLKNFAFKTSLAWWIFALAGLVILGIAVLTVSWQSWRAATRNPVEALRYE